MNRRLPVIALLTCFAATALTGCTVEVIDQAGTPQDSSSASQSSVSAPSEQAEPADDAPATEASENVTRTEVSESASSDGGLSSEVQEARDAAAAVATTKLRCDGDLTIDTVGAVVRVDGDCTSITVTADIAVVVADNVGTVRVSGTGNVVYALRVQTVEIAGDTNVVTWAGTTPTVTDTGVGNVATQG